MNQTYIDLGQRNFGRTVECRECGFIYAEGEANDEAAHRKHHKQALQAVCVRSVLAELHVVGEREDGDRIVALRDTDGAEALRKIAQAKARLDAELGSTPALADQGLCAMMLLEAYTGRLRGFALVEPRECAHRAVPPELDDGARGAEDASAGALCHDGTTAAAMAGISHIWTDPRDRRRGVARALLDAARKHFATGFELPRSQLAFSQPTALGRCLAAAYSGTERFLVYG